MGKIRHSIIALGLLAIGSAWIPPVSASGVPVDQATSEQKQSAQKFFVDAKKLFDDKQLDQALVGFRASYDVVASPNSLLMVARTLQALDRIEEAYSTYEQVIREADEAAQQDERYAPTSEAARKELEEIRPRVGLLTLQILGATEDTEVFINDQSLLWDRWEEEVLVRVGVISLTAKAPGKPEHHEDLTVAGGSLTHRVDLAAIWAPPPPVEDPIVETSAGGSVDLLGLDKRTWAYIAGGVGVAGVATFGVFGAMNRSKFKSLDSDCPNSVCPTDRSDDIDAGKRYQTIANVGLIVGVVGLGTGTVLYLMSDDKSGREEPTTQVGFGPGSISVQGRF